MTQATIVKKVDKTVAEMQRLIKQSKRKLLELEVIVSLSEIKRGKIETIKDIKAFFKRLK